MLLPGEAEDATRFAAALKALPSQPRPSQSNPDLRLEGLPHISEIVGDWLDRRSRPQFAVVEGMH